jgi:RNA polymerase sigma-70 factor (ECF subfamily)
VADDLLQTTFLKLHRARTSYRPELPARPWVFTIAAGVRRDELRRRYRLPPHVAEEEWELVEATLGPTLDQAEEDSGKEVRDTVRAALDRLPESQRVVVHLHRYEGMTFEEIARVLSTTPGGVRARACRAYERLREELRPLLEVRAEGTAPS